MGNSISRAKRINWACASLVWASVLCVVAVDYANGGAIAASALGSGKARAAGGLSGPEQGQQADSDIDPFGPVGPLTPKRADVRLEDSGKVLSAEAEVRQMFDFELRTDSVHTPSGPNQVWGSAGPEDPFVAPIVSVPGIDGLALLSVSGGNLDMDGITLSGAGEYNVNGYLELAVLDVGTSANLETVANIVDAAGSVEKAEADGLLPVGVNVLSKWRETDLSPDPGPFNFDLSVPLAGATDIQDRIMLHGVAHAVPEPSAATLALLALIFGFPRALWSRRRTSGA